MSGKHSVNERHKTHSWKDKFIAKRIYVTRNIRNHSNFMSVELLPSLSLVLSDGRIVISLMKRLGCVWILQIYPLHRFTGKSACYDPSVVAGSYLHKPHRKTFSEVLPLVTSRRVTCFIITSSSGQPASLLVKLLQLSACMPQQVSILSKNFFPD
jgi:hypothetical protein